MPRGRKRIYCEQYGLFWVFDLEGFLGFCLEGVMTGSHDLNKYGRQLRGRPKGIYRPRGSRQSFGGDPNVLLFHPLDWHPEDYEQSGKEATRWWGKR